MASRPRPRARLRPHSHLQEPLDKEQIERFRATVQDGKNAPVLPSPPPASGPWASMLFGLRSKGSSICEIIAAKEGGCCINKDYALKN
jgi:hypothetical protein